MGTLAREKSNFWWRLNPWSSSDNEYDTTQIPNGRIYSPKELTQIYIMHCTTKVCQKLRYSSRVLGSTEVIICHCLYPSPIDCFVPSQHPTVGSPQQQILVIIHFAIHILNFPIQIWRKSPHEVRTFLHLIFRSQRHVSTRIPGTRTKVFQEYLKK